MWIPVTSVGAQWGIGLCELGLLDLNCCLRGWSWSQALLSSTVRARRTRSGDWWQGGLGTLSCRWTSKPSSKATSNLWLVPAWDAERPPRLCYWRTSLTSKACNLGSLLWKRQNFKVGWHPRCPSRESRPSAIWDWMGLRCRIPSWRPPCSTSIRSTWWPPVSTYLWTLEPDAELSCQKPIMRSTSTLSRRPTSHRFEMEHMLTWSNPCMRCPGKLELFGAYTWLLHYVWPVSVRQSLSGHWWTLEVGQETNSHLDHQAVPLQRDESTMPWWSPTLLVGRFSSWTWT